jgi:hypothetical protein
MERDGQQIVLGSSHVDISTKGWRLRWATDSAALAWRWVSDYARIGIAGVPEQLHFG